MGTLTNSLAGKQNFRTESLELPWCCSGQDSELHLWLGK